jgi:hypothetical protein
MARTEWGCADHEACVAAVEADFKHIKGWYNDDWFWLSVGVAPLNDDGKPVEDYRTCCGGYESTILGSDENNTAWRNAAIDDQIHQVEYDIRKALYPNQLEMPFA